MGGRIDILGGTLIKSRVLEGGEWSALNEALFIAGDRAHDLYVSELMYHPEDGGAEFLEITNRGSVRHVLDDLRITGGIQFEFSEASVAALEPGARVVLVRDAGTFSQVYPTVNWGGYYEGGLGNGGDSFSLEEVGGDVLWTLSYSDDLPWPKEADGQGRSLVFVSGERNEAGSWRASVELGGNPGTSDRVDFVDGDDLLAYAVDEFKVSVNKGLTMLELTMNGGADEAVSSVQSSSDLMNWDEVEGGSQELVADKVKRTWEVGGAEGRKFFRVVVDQVLE